MQNTIPTIIRKRFCGPPNSGNGGYVCGLLANALGEPAQVTLHAPPPLDPPSAWPTPKPPAPASAATSSMACPAVLSAVPTAASTTACCCTPAR